jgi:hypothetical protein
MFDDWRRLSAWSTSRLEVWDFAEAAEELLSSDAPLCEEEMKQLNECLAKMHKILLR